MARDGRGMARAGGGWRVMTARVTPDQSQLHLGISLSADEPRVAGRTPPVVPAPPSADGRLLRADASDHVPPPADHHSGVELEHDET